MSLINKLQKLINPKVPTEISVDLANRRNKADAFGLLAFRSQVPETVSGTARVVAEFGPMTKSLSLDEVTASRSDGKRNLHVHVNSHLFADGPSAFRLTVTDADGTVYRTKEMKVEVANTGMLAAAVAGDLKAHGTPAMFGIPVDSRQFPYASGAAKAWFNEPSGDDVALSFEPAATVEEAHRHLNRWGFTLLNDVLPAQMAQDYLKDLSEAIANGAIAGDFTSSNRIHGGHKLPTGRKIWLYPPVLSFLKDHFRDDPCACQTLTFLNGSEQNAHQDTIHLTPYPAGYMCGVWIALQDVEPGSGELFVYPGSHLAQRFTSADLGLAKVSDDYSSYAVFDEAVRDLIRDQGFERHEYRPKIGQILVWHENLIHGGAPRRDATVRRNSIVSHYFARGAVSYYDGRGEASSLESISS